MEVDVEDSSPCSNIMVSKSKKDKAKPKQPEWWSYKLTLGWQDALMDLSKAMLRNLRAEVVHDFVKATKMEVPIDFFAELANNELAQGNFAEAAVCIVNDSMYDRFDCHQLCIDLVDVNKIKECKLILTESKDTELLHRVIQSLSSPKYAKTATKLIIDYELDPDTFPNLMTIIARNNSIYYISRVFKRPDHSDYMPLYKVEDML